MITVADIEKREKELLRDKERFNKIRKLLLAKDLKITWETDINKIDIRALKSYPGFNDFESYTFLKIGNKTITNKPAPKIEHIFESIEAFADLIELIKTGTKIIPPIDTIETTYFDGTAKHGSVREYDGSHRTRIATYLGLNEIPVLLYERPTKYIFTPKKWKFTENRKTGRITATEINGNNKIEFSGKFTYINTISREFIEIHRSGI